MCCAARVAGPGNGSVASVAAFVQQRSAAGPGWRTWVISTTSATSRMASRASRLLPSSSVQLRGPAPPCRHRRLSTPAWLSYPIALNDVQPRRAERCTGLCSITWPPRASEVSLAQSPMRCTCCVNQVCRSSWCRSGACDRAAATASESHLKGRLCMTFRPLAGKLLGGQSAAPGSKNTEPPAARVARAAATTTAPGSSSSTNPFSISARVSANICGQPHTPLATQPACHRAASPAVPQRSQALVGWCTDDNLPIAFQQSRLPQLATR